MRVRVRANGVHCREPLDPGLPAADAHQGQILVTVLYKFAHCGPRRIAVARQPLRVTRLAHDEGADALRGPGSHFGGVQMRLGEAATRLAFLG